MILLGSKLILLIGLNLYYIWVVHSSQFQLTSSDKAATYESESDRKLRGIRKFEHERPVRPPRSSSYGTRPDEDPTLVRKNSTGTDDNDTSITSAHQFVINGLKTNEELASGCRNSMIETIEVVLQKIVEESEGNRKLNDQPGLTRSLLSSSRVEYLSFTNLNSCPNAHNSVAVKFITVVTFEGHITTLNSQTLDDKIIESVNNGQLRETMYRYGFPGSDTLSLTATLCPGDTLSPSAYPSITPTVRQPTNTAVSLLFQVALVGGKTSVELSECCREQVLNGARKSLGAVLSSLSGRHLHNYDRYLAGNGILDLQIESIWDNPDCPQNKNCLEIEYDMWVTKDADSDGEALATTVKSNMVEEVRSGTFSSNLQSEGLDVVASIPVTESPSYKPSLSIQPSISPTKVPSDAPSFAPTKVASSVPSKIPSSEPSSAPSSIPSKHPSLNPSSNPTTYPSENPTFVPSLTPTKNPSSIPTIRPSLTPSSNPTNEPSKKPSSSPTLFPSLTPTIAHSVLPTITPSSNPSYNPTSNPTNYPSNNPTFVPSLTPTIAHSVLPTITPSSNPTSYPSDNPTSIPSLNPTKVPSSIPTTRPTPIPTHRPTPGPTSNPTPAPTASTGKAPKAKKNKLRKYHF